MPRKMKKSHTHVNLNLYLLMSQFIWFTAYLGRRGIIYHLVPWEYLLPSTHSFQISLRQSWKTKLWVLKNQLGPWQRLLALQRTLGPATDWVVWEIEQGSEGLAQETTRRRERKEGAPGSRKSYFFAHGELDESPRRSPLLRLTLLRSGVFLGWTPSGSGKRWLLVLGAEAKDSAEGISHEKETQLSRCLGSNSRACLEWVVTF